MISLINYVIYLCMITVLSQISFGDNSLCVMQILDSSHSAEWPMLLTENCQYQVVDTTLQDTKKQLLATKVTSFKTGEKYCI